MGGSRNAETDPDYDQPAIMRSNPNRGRSSVVMDAQPQGIETLDIPAFLRRQAD
jgi:hypothetical protein